MPYIGTPCLLILFTYVLNNEQFWTVSACTEELFVMKSLTKIFVCPFLPDIPDTGIADISEGQRLIWPFFITGYSGFL
jgi:hypothetical protein